MRTSLQGIAKRAGEQKKHRFQDLYRMLNEEFLKDCWRDIRKDAASGVDEVSAEQYEENLEENVRELVERLKRKRYRARLVKRAYIPKGDGRKRPLGIPVIEDKLLQMGVKRILEAIYEQDFLPCSYGYRLGVGALDAVKDLTGRLQFGRYSFIVEADIKSYFDNVDHDWMTRMLEERLDDSPFVRLIGKWLKAGVLETEGKVTHPVTGTPQGGVVSPILANIYLHYALDLWFEKVVKKHCRGKAYLVRYADDYVCAFEYRGDAERFYRAMVKRLKRFGLELSAEKTRIMTFDRKPPRGWERFEFLGFEFYWGMDRGGRPRVKRRTSRKNLRRSIKRFTAWCKENLHLGLRELFWRLNAKLRGYYKYYGVLGNCASLKQFFEQVVRILHKWLNRRSQRRSYNWPAYKAILKHYAIAEPRINRKRKTRQLLLV